MAWAGRILRVNLTKGTCAAEPLNMKWARDYIGQRGLATKYFTTEVDAQELAGPCHESLPCSQRTALLALPAHWRMRSRPVQSAST